MAKKKIFVSFDFEKDRHYKYALNMWDKNPEFEFTCDDRSPSEIQTDSVAVVKNVLSRKINEATYVIVIVGEDANKLHKDWRVIGRIMKLQKLNNLGKGLLLFRLTRTTNIRKN